MTQRIAVGVTIVNLVVGVVFLAQMRPATAQDIAPVLRGRALQIVDDQGRVRASITVGTPGIADAGVLLNLSSDPGGGPSVLLQTSTAGSLLRLAMGDPRGAPGVKLEANRDSSGLRLGDGLDTGIDVTAKPTGNFVRVTNRDGRQQTLQP